MKIVRSCYAHPTQSWATLSLPPFVSQCKCILRNSILRPSVRIALQWLAFTRLVAMSQTQNIWSSAGGLALQTGSHLWCSLGGCCWLREASQCRALSAGGQGKWRISAVIQINGFRLPCAEGHFGHEEVPHVHELGRVVSFGAISLPQRQPRSGVEKGRMVENRAPLKMAQVFFLVLFHNMQRDSSPTFSCNSWSQPPKSHNLIWLGLAGKTHFYARLPAPSQTDHVRFLESKPDAQQLDTYQSNRWPLQTAMNVTMWVLYLRPCNHKATSLRVPCSFTTDFRSQAGAAPQPSLCKRKANL